MSTGCGVVVARALGGDVKQRGAFLCRARDKFNPEARPGQESPVHAILVPFRPADPLIAEIPPSSIPYVNEAPPWADYNTVAVTTWAYMLDGLPSAEDGDLVRLRLVFCRVWVGGCVLGPPKKNFFFAGQHHGVLYLS